MRAAARLAGVFLLLAGALAIASFAFPATWPVLVAPPAEALDLVTATREWSQLGVVLGSLAAIAALIGLLATATLVGRTVLDSDTGNTAAIAGLGTAAAGVALWLVAHTVQGTNLLMANAQGASATDLAYLVITEIGHVLLLTAGTVLAAGFAVAAFGLRRHPALARWGGAALAVGAIGEAALVATRNDLLTSAALVIVLPALGIALLTARPVPAPVPATRRSAPPTPAGRGGRP